MNAHPGPPLKTGSARERGARPGVKWAVAAAGLICLAGLLWVFRGQLRAPANPPEAAGSSAEPQAAATDTAAQPPASARAAEGAGARSATPVPVDPALAALVAGLNRLSGTNMALTAEAVAAWRTNFMELVQSGPAAIPALKAFLDQKTDDGFSQQAAQALGYGTARLAAIDALRQIGGADAIAAMSGLLGATQSPAEIAVLARDLEEAAPGQYRQQALDAARAGLAAAAASKDAQLDVAPLFEVFQHYGDASVVPDLENAMGQWKYYAAIALANLPNNAGVASILRLADPASGSRVVGLEMVAQLAATNPEARQFLATQVANQAIPSSLWPYLASPLAGDQYFPVNSAITTYPQLQSASDLKTTHLSLGNQNLYTLPANQNLAPEGIAQQLALVNELLNSAADPAAIQALQQARTTLTQRSNRPGH